MTEKWLTESSRAHARAEADRWYMRRSHLPEAERWQGTTQRAADKAVEAFRMTERDDARMAPFFDSDEYARIFLERLFYLCSEEGKQAKTEAQ